MSQVLEFINNWAVIIAFFVYLGHRWYDLKLKKREINFSLFQKRRLDAVNEYFKVYAKLEDMFMTFPYYEIFNLKKEMEAGHSLPINQAMYDLRKSTLELGIYFEGEEYKAFDRVINNMEDIRKCVGGLYSQRMLNIVAKGLKQSFPKTAGVKKEDRNNEIVKEFLRIRDSLLKENLKILKELTIMIRGTFNLSTESYFSALISKMRQNK